MERLIASNRMFWAVFSLTMIIYAIMVIYTLPTIAEEAGGLFAFDLRPTGYSHDEAIAFLTALSPKGHELYSGLQRRLDLAYPILLAITTAWAIVRLTPFRWRRLKYILAATAFPGMIFDYLENDGVAALLARPVADITAEHVATVSTYSQMKATFGTISLTILLILLIIFGITRFRNRRERELA